MPEIRPYKNVPHEAVIEYPSTIAADIDSDACTFCGQCATACIHDAIELDRNAEICAVRDDVCIGCGFCAGLCPTNAISIVRKADGRVIWSGQGTVDVDWVTWS